MADLGIGKDLIIYLLLKTEGEWEKNILGKKSYPLLDMIEEFCDLINFKSQHVDNYPDAEKAIPEEENYPQIRLIKKEYMDFLFGKFDKALILKISSKFNKNNIILATDFLYYFSKIFKDNIFSEMESVIKNSPEDIYNESNIFICNECKIYFLSKTDSNLCPLCEKNGRAFKDEFSLKVLQNTQKKYELYRELYKKNIIKYDENIKYYMECINHSLNPKNQLNNDYLVELLLLDKYLFNWDKIPGIHSDKFRKHLLQNFSINLVGKYLFSWDEIPVNENGRLIEFLKHRFGIDWEKIEKIDDGNTIKVFTKKKYISLELNDEKTKVKLLIDNSRTDEFIAKMENGKLNIYGKAKIEKDDDGKKINISTENNNLSLRLNNEETEAYLTINGIEKGRYIVKEENGGLSIYENINPKFEIDMKNIEILITHKKNYLALYEAYFNIKLHYLTSFYAAKCKDTIESAFSIAGFKIYESDSVNQNRYRVILFTRFNHSVSPSKIYEIWTQKLKECLNNNVQYIYHGYNTNEMICLIHDETFDSIKKNVIDKILNEFNKDKELIIESSTIFSPHKNHPNGDEDNFVNYMIFVKIVTPKRLIINELNEKIIFEIENISKNFSFCMKNCTNKDHPLPLNICKKMRKIERINISECQGYFDISIFVKSNNPCLVSTLSYNLRQFSEIKDTSTIVLIDMGDG